MPDQPIRYVRIPVNVVQDLANYLATRPFREVASFMAYFGQLKAEDEPAPHIEPAPPRKPAIIKDAMQ